MIGIGLTACRRVCRKRGTTFRYYIFSTTSGEDGAEMSAAGQMETVLGAKGLVKVCTTYDSPTDDDNALLTLTTH